jgi:hypothetical protein
MNTYPDEIVDAENLTAGSLINGASKVTHVASKVTNVVADQLTAAAKSAAGYIRSSPWQAAGAVALVAIAAGILVSRAARRSRRMGRAAKFVSSPEAVGG